MTDQVRERLLDEIAACLADAVHVTHDRWAEVQGDERIRGVVYFARHCLGALYVGDDKAADQALSKMDAARALIDACPPDTSQPVAS